MKRFRISGLVRLAKCTRQELSGPISPARLVQLRRNVGNSIIAIERLARKEGVRLEDLPPPSRKAYEFLKGLDFDSVVPRNMPRTNGFSPESVSFSGLQSSFNSILNTLARCGGPADRENMYRVIRSASEDIEGQIRVKDIRPEQIKRQSRAVRGWLAYFSQRQNFDGYLATVRGAEPVFRAVSPWATAQSGRIVIHFRPLPGVYRIRRSQDGALVQLPTPMMYFERDLFGSLAQMAFRKSPDRRPVLDAMRSDPYQRVLSELELLSGVVVQTSGLYHDLAASFDRVNATCFDGRMARPRLVWSRTFTSHKFGHYDHARDTIMVSMSLDKKSVPVHTVDFIVYHELLHKQLGVLWKDNRMAAHTREFVERERRFQQYGEAKAVLRKLASEQ